MIFSLGERPQAYAWLMLTTPSILPRIQERRLACICGIISVSILTPRRVPCLSLGSQALNGSGALPSSIGAPLLPSSFGDSLNLHNGTTLLPVIDISGPYSWVPVPPSYPSTAVRPCRDHCGDYDNDIHMPLLPPFFVSIDVLREPPRSRN